MQENKYSEKIVHDGKILALVIRSQSVEEFGKTKEKFCFPTPEDFTLQFGMQNRSKDEIIEPHFHLPFTDIKTLPVQEFVYVLSGKIKVDIYSDTEDIVEEVIMSGGDGIIFNTGHGLTILEDAKILELKQGPYRGREEEKRSINK